MADDDLIATIDKLVAEEHEIRASGDPDPDRLAHLEVTLDQCWDLLRQRRARREYDQPDTSDVRPPRWSRGTSSEPPIVPPRRPLWHYVVDHTEPVDPVVARLTERTQALGGVAGMQIGPDQQALLTMLTRFAGVTNAVEVGTFTGTSALCIARGLAEGGRLLCCDVSEEWTAIAREAWAEAGVDDRIDLRIAPGDRDAARRCHPTR